MELPRNDLHLTTTGVGHALRPGHPFPSPDIQVSRTRDALNDCLAMLTYFSSMVLSRFPRD